jgi:hypothetical protein
MSDDDTGRLAREAFDLHERVMAWLLATAPGADPLVVIAALSYELGRQVGRVTHGMPPAEVDAMLENVREVMREHVTAFQHGLRH